MTEDKKQNQSQLMETSLIETIATIKNDEEQNNQKNNSNKKITVVTIDVEMDVEKILRAQFEMFKEIYDLGCNVSSPHVTLSEPFASTSPIYIGIYDKTAYGVYDDQSKFQKSQTYWHSSSVNKQEFSTYDEALVFARKGVALLNGISENAVPDLQHSINWRQKI